MNYEIENITFENPTITIHDCSTVYDELENESETFVSFNIKDENDRSVLKARNSKARGVAPG